MEFLFIITNGSGYIYYDTNQKMATTNKRELAKRFTKEKAENFMKNLSGTMKNLGYRMEPDDETNQVIEQVINDNDESIAEILAQVCNFESYMQDISKRRDTLAYELSKVDAEIEDILHAAEFYNLNACEGYKLYKMLRDARIKRRKLKDYIEVVGYVERATGKDFANNAGSKSILGKGTREYTPRVLNELFNR